MFLLFSLVYSKKRNIAISDTTSPKAASTDEIPFRKVFRIPSNPLRFIGFLMFAVFFTLVWLGDQSILIKIGISVLFGFLVLYIAAETIRAKLVLSNTGIEYYTAIGKVSFSWDNISEIIKRRTGDDVLILKSGSFTGLWKGKVNDYEISLTNFDIDWRTREIGKIIAKYAPLQFLEE